MNALHLSCFVFLNFLFANPVVSADVIKGNIPEFAQSYPVGYARSGNLVTTGGKGGPTVIVKSLDDFKDAAKSRGPLIIKVSGRLYGSGMIDVASNKTIIGLPGATLTGVGLALYRVNNIIIKNMRINKVVGADCITIKELSHHVWVDHCELWGDRSHGWDYYDELLEVTDRSSYVTISNTIFRDHHTGILIGGHDLAKADIGYLKVTIYGNYFYNISERAPGMRLGYVHVFNNYFVNSSGRSGYAIGCTTGGTVRTDNNYFKNQAIPIFTDFNHGPGVISGASTNIYVNCGTNKISTPPSRWIPPYRYKEILLAASEVPRSVLKNAGPR
ncbi:MAG TPA: hypothetical protein VGD31_06645 [Sphingobacteriaceae bacterium]